MHRPRQRQKTQKHALMRNELRYLCYLPPQLGQPRHNNVLNDRCISTIHRADGVGVKLCNLFFFYIPFPSECQHTHKHTHTCLHIPTTIQSKVIIRVMRKVKTITGHSSYSWEETLLCHYDARQLLFASDKAYVVSRNLSYSGRVMA